MFKTMTGCLNPKLNPTDEDLQKIQSYIFCRWLSGNIYTILASNQINLYSDIPIENQYHMIKSVFAGKIKYIPYPKNISEENLKQVEYISDFFKISNEKAKEYIEIIDKNELNQIVQMYTEYYNKGK